MLRTGVFVALVANTATRLITAWVSGGLAYALRVDGALLAGLLAALAAGVLALDATRHSVTALRGYGWPQTEESLEDRMKTTGAPRGGQEIVVYREEQAVDRVQAQDIARVVFVHQGG